MSVMNKAKGAARKIISPIVDARERRTKAPVYTAVHNDLDPERHVAEAVGWLMRAQDDGSDRGVSYGTEFGAGFLPSYPETTGYIIPTFIMLTDRYGDEQYLRRAVEMGEWEVSIQLSSGAVMGGMYNANPTPAVFNTGMVLLGWADLFKKTHSDRFAKAGKSAAQWLLEMQEPNGNWIRGNSEFANASATVYNVKAAWGLAHMGVALGQDSFVDAAVRNADFALSKQAENGWFSDCCLVDSLQPLLHTIAYTMQGLIGIGEIARRQDFIDAAARTAESLRKIMDEKGFIPGRIDRDFSAAADWCCLTGTAQSSIVWSDLERLTANPRYGQAAELANTYLMARHDISSADLSIRGGLAGSWPVWGPYGKYKVLNWATKFFVDALLLRNIKRMSPAVT